MTSRVGGVLALIAVAILAGAMFVPWWDGHPTVDGNDVHMLDVDIGLFGGERCNTGGDGVCTKLPLVGGFKTLEAIEVGALALAGAMAIAVGALALGGNKKRKSLGRVSIATGAAAAIVGLVLIATGPDIHVQQTVTVPTGFGGIVGLFGGVLAAVASVIARRDDPPVIPRAVATKAPPHVTVTTAPLEPMQPPGFDVHALIADDALRPTQLPSEPRLGQPVPPSNTGNLPGPRGPLVPPGQQSAPLFAQAPQLRPLYEMPGSGAFVPPAPPPLPSRAPTPIARAELEDDGPSAARRPPLRRTAPPPPTRPPNIAPPGSQGPPMSASGGTRPPPIGPGAMAQTSIGVGPLVPPLASQAQPLPPMLPPRPPMPPARVPAPPPPAPLLRGHVPTPPPLELPTPEPVSAEIPAVSGSQLVIDDDEDSQDDDSQDDDSQDDDSQDDEPSFDRLATYGLRGDAPRDGNAVDDNTSPGLDIALEETPAAHLLAPDDIETRGIRKLAQRELDEPMTTPRPVRTRSSEQVLSSAKRPAPVRAPAPDTDENEVLEAPDGPEMTNDPTGDTGDPTVDHEPVFGGASSPPRMKSPPPGALRANVPNADFGHAATDLAPAPSLPALKAAQLPSKQIQVAPRVPPIAIVAAAAPAVAATAAAAAAASPASPAVAQPPPPKALKTPAPNAGPQPACPQCEAPMSWVDEHLRFYCRSCKMYF